MQEPDPIYEPVLATPEKGSSAEESKEVANLDLMARKSSN